MHRLKKRLRLAVRSGSARWLKVDRDDQIIRSYLAGSGAKKLQIGCGRRMLEGWLNSDYYPKTRNVLHLDATRRLPFDDATFDYIFSEHMIEHVAFAQGQDLLRECFRVLVPGGTLRLSTPDLAFLIDLYRVEEDPSLERTPLQTEFLENFLAVEIKDRKRNAPRDHDTFLINEFVRAGGHEFIYDEKTLRLALTESGFNDIVRCQVLESEHEALRGLEHVDRKPPGHIALESMVLEASMSASGSTANPG